MKCLHSWPGFLGPDGVPQRTFLKTVYLTELRKRLHACAGELKALQAVSETDLYCATALRIIQNIYRVLKIANPLQVSVMRSSSGEKHKTNGKEKKWPVVCRLWKR